MSNDPATTAAAAPAGRGQGAGLLPTGAAFLVVVALFMLSLEGLRQVTAIAAPVFLALTLVLSVDPLRRRMVDQGVPLWAATVAMLVILFGVLSVVLLGIVAALTQLVTVLPDYREEFDGLYDRAVAQLEGAGVEIGTLDEVLSGIDPGSVVPYLQTVVDGVGRAGALVILLGLSILFLTLDLGSGRRRLAAVSRHRPDLAASLRDFAHRVRRYWVVSTVFGAAQGGLDAGLLMILDVPLPLVWGMLAFLSAYIPSIGFFIGLIPVALLGLLEGGVGTMVAVILGYMAINFVVKTLVMPKFAGDAVGLNITTVFLSLVFWAIVVGPLGALLAIPLTLFAKAVLIDSHPRSRWLGTFMVSSDRIERPGDAGT